MRELHFDIYIATKPETIWAALTEAKGVGALYFGSRLDTTFALGSPYRYVGADHNGAEVVHVEGEILACKRNEYLQLSHRAGEKWRKGQKIHTSRVAYQITDLGFATKLSVIHDQWHDDDPSYVNNANGWMIFLSSAKSYLETGKPLPIPMH